MLYGNGHSHSQSPRRLRRDSCLKGIDAEVGKGEIAVILGGSGCGKSTLLKTITGLIEPREGRVEVLGINTATLDEESQSELAKRLGVMFQYGALLNSLTVGENIALPLEMHTDLPPAQIEEIVRLRLASVSLEGTQDRMPSELSGACANEWHLLVQWRCASRNSLCDEPSAGLDPVTAAEIDELLLTLNRALGITIVIVTHELLSIDRLDGRLLMLDEGQVVFSGSVGEAQRSTHDVVYPFFTLEKHHRDKNHYRSHKQQRRDWQRKRYSLALPSRYETLPRYDPRISSYCR